MSAGGGPLGNANPLDSIKKLLIVLVASVLFATIVTGAVVLLGLTETVPEVELVSVGVVLGPLPVLFVPVFLLCFVVGVVYVFFGATLVEKVAQTRAQLGELPPAAQAVLAAIPFAVVAWIAGLLTDLVAFDLPPFVPEFVALLSWVGITAVTYRHLSAGGSLGRWLTMLVTGGVFATVLALSVVALDLVLGSGTIPGFVPYVVFLLAAPILTYLVVRRIRSEVDGFLSTLLVKTGFAQLRQLQTLTVAIVAGVLPAIAAAVLVSLAFGGLLGPAVALVLVWLLASFVAAQFLDRTTVASEDLVIEEVVGRSSRRRELAVRNDSDESVDLRSAKIRDTEYNLYRTNIQLLLAPGETSRFDIPPEFALYPNEDDEIKLPLGFSISQRTESPVIVTRDGVKYRLRWDDGFDESGRPIEEPAGDPTE